MEEARPCSGMTNVRLMKATRALCAILCTAAAPIGIGSALRRNRTPTDKIQPWAGNAYGPFEWWYDTQLHPCAPVCHTREVILLIDTLYADVLCRQSRYFFPIFNVGAKKWVGTEA